MLSLPQKGKKAQGGAKVVCSTYDQHYLHQHYLRPTLLTPTLLTTNTTYTNTTYDQHYIYAEEGRRGLRANTIECQDS